MTSRLKIVEIIKNIILHTIEELDLELEELDSEFEGLGSELKQQQLRQQHIQYEIQENIKIISKTIIIKRKRF